MRLVRAVPGHKVTEVCGGTTRGCPPATPRVRALRHRSKVCGARPTAVAISAGSRGVRRTTSGCGASGGRCFGFEKRLRTMTGQRKSGQVDVDHRKETNATKDRLTRHRLEMRGGTASDRSEQPPNRNKQIRNTGAVRNGNEGAISFRSSPGNAVNLEPHLLPRLTFEIVASPARGS